MKLLVLFSVLLIIACKGPDKKPQQSPLPAFSSPGYIPTKPYMEIKEDVATNRKQFATRYPFVNDSVQAELSNYWINTISHDLYSYWQNTPWDFNGTTTTPQQGSIACGYFVTTILQDMNLQINRVKLSTCASSEMMKSLTPQQKIKNLSYLNYSVFNDTIAAFGKGVYIIGLDFHTGFIINDGTENWFIHSNYIDRKGVTKERIIDSDALKSSKTRWLISLTNDRAFLQRWLKG